jgi:hypothetical protein
MDLTESIAPNSAQLNAEDLLAGSRVVTITEVRKGPSAEQPVAVVLAEFGDDRPYLPCKSMRRVMVVGWGADASKYTGRRMTIYNDPSVKWGGFATGGIRIQAMSHITKPMTLALTVTRGKRAPFTVQPLPDAPAAEPDIDYQAEAAAATDITGWRTVWQQAKAAGHLNEALKAQLTPIGEALRAGAGDPTDAAPRDIIPPSVQQATPVVDELPIPGAES